MVRKKIIHLIPLAIAVTALFATLYLTIQQNYRMSADDPQIQMAEDAATALGNGANPSDLNSSSKIDVAKSLAAFYIIFDQKGKVVSSNASLNNTTPTPPVGVFNSFNNKSIKSMLGRSNSTEDRFTWQPEGGVRIAAVLVKYDKGFVLAGRSLREVEAREDNLTQIVGLGFLFTLAASLIASIIL